MKFALVGALALCVLCSCSSRQQKPISRDLAAILKQQTETNGRACVRIADIRGFGYKNGVVRIDGIRRYYLAITAMRCLSMDMATAAVFEGPGGEICGGGGSRIRHEGSECIISHVFEFDNRELAFTALDKAYSERSAAQQTPQ